MVVPMRLLISRAIGVLAATAVSASFAYAQTAPGSPTRQQPAGSGRVIVTITVLEGTVRMAGVDVALRSLDGNMVLAKTVSDGAGQVTFPDVPAGRYTVQATRPGFVTSTSTYPAAWGGA